MVRDEFHCQRLDGRQLVEFFKGAGFERVTFEPFMWAPVATLPYIRVRVSPAFAVRADQIVRSVRLLNFSFVNQLVVGVRPVGK
jgi:hypothetical protein